VGTDAFHTPAVGLVRERADAPYDVMRSIAIHYDLPQDVARRVLLSQYHDRKLFRLIGTENV
jgi:hypothetical protein